MATVSVQNYSKPAPKWFRKAEKAILILTVAANTMIASWGFKNELLAARLQLWCTIGIVAVLKATEAVLADEEEPQNTEA